MTYVSLVRAVELSRQLAPKTISPGRFAPSLWTIRPQFLDKSPQSLDSSPPSCEEKNCWSTFICEGVSFYRNCGAASVGVLQDNLVLSTELIM